MSMNFTRVILSFELRATTSTNLCTGRHGRVRFGVEDRETGRSRGFSFAEMASKEEAHSHLAFDGNDVAVALSQWASRGRIVRRRLRSAEPGGQPITLQTRSSVYRDRECKGRTDFRRAFFWLREGSGVSSLVAEEEFVLRCVNEPSSGRSLATAR